MENHDLYEKYWNIGINYIIDRLKQRYPGKKITWEVDVADINMETGDPYDAVFFSVDDKRVFQVSHEIIYALGMALDFIENFDNFYLEEDEES